MCELLSPVGDFECLKAAVQNGADSVYLGSSSFNARARAKNFGAEELENAINYAKTRNVKVHLTLNTLIKNEEFMEAVNLAIAAYNIGVDAIIIQDIGLASYLLKNYPMIPLHASTQMTCHNLAGVKQLEELGFKRVVLSRELSLDEIKHIRENTKCELEIFVHGALCISYSGQCLLSSMIGGRSGNRGQCAQPCRMYYSLMEENNSSKKEIERGYLLSPKDNLGIMYLPELIKMGIDSFKIEGRMKTPLYVATITRIYRKYIDYIKKNIDKDIDELKTYISKNLDIVNQDTGLTDKEEILQVFNRGGMSNGHFSPNGNSELVYKKAPNNIGIKAGKIENLNINKGYITFKSLIPFSLGDKVTINDNIYNVSELMKGRNNIKSSSTGDVVTIGRMKGNIKQGDIISKVEDSNLTKRFAPTFKENKAFKKITLDCKLTIKHGQNISMEIIGKNGFSKNISYVYDSNFIPEEATHIPTTKLKVAEQVSKTGNTEFCFENIFIDIDDGLFVNMKDINEIRRKAIDNFRMCLLNNYKHNLPFESYINMAKNKVKTKQTTTILLNLLNDKYDYSKLANIDNIYIPLKYFLNKNNKSQIDVLCKKANVYVYMPHVLRDSICKKINIEEVNNFKINGFVISNISQIKLLSDLESINNYEIIGNYNLNVYNNNSINFLKELGLNKITISPELNINEINSNENCEVILYGKIPVMTNQYCYLGHSTKCKDNCDKKCMNQNKYYLKDKFGSEFRIIPDNISTTTTMYFDKALDLNASKLISSMYRFDFLDESIDEINMILSKKL